jgi:hypothetical protein
MVVISSILLVIALLAGTGHLLKSGDFLSYSLANIHIFAHLMGSDSIPEIFYPLGVYEQEFKVNQVRIRAYKGKEVPIWMVYGGLLWGREKQHR